MCVKEEAGGEARWGCGPLTLVQGADTDKLRLVRQGSLLPLYTSLSPALPPLTSAAPFTSSLRSPFVFDCAFV